MKPRSLFDNPDAWVAKDFKRPPTPRSVVTLPPREPAFPPVAELWTKLSDGSGYSAAVQRIIKGVSVMSRMPVEQIIGKSQKPEPAVVRQVAIWIARRFTDRSLTCLAKEFRRDHSTICTNIKRVDRTIAENSLAPDHDTPEAWTRLLLTQHRADKQRRLRRFAKEQSAMRLAKYAAMRKAGIPNPLLGRRWKRKRGAE